MKSMLFYHLYFVQAGPATSYIQPEPIGCELKAERLMSKAAEPFIPALIELLQA